LGLADREVKNGQKSPFSILSTSDVFGQSKAAFQCSYDDFTFIDSSMVMLTVLDRPVTLQIWRFGDDTASRVGTFEMPATTLDTAYFAMHFDGGSTASVGRPKSLDGTPFALEPTPRTIALSFSLIETDTELEELEAATYTMMMQPSLMIDAVKKAQNPLQRFSGHGLEWKKWGPQCTRWIAQDGDNLNWDPSSAGGRLVTITPGWPAEAPPEGLDITTLPQVIQLYDFRPEIIRRYMNEEMGPNEELVVGETVVHKSGIFLEDVISSLPYHVVTSGELPFRVSGAMLDEGHIIGTQVISNPSL